MRETFIAVNKKTAEELNLTSVRQNVGNYYLLREKDIAHLEGSCTDEKSERIGGHLLDSVEAMQFLQGKLKLNKRKIQYGTDSENAEDNSNL